MTIDINNSENNKNNNKTKEKSNIMTSIINPSVLIYMVAAIVPITLITTYTITEVYHPDPQAVPFISSSINNAPESCIGSYGLSISSFCMVLIILIRYLLIKNNILILKNLNNDEKKIQRLNSFSTIMGVVSGFSMNGVASFQYKNAHIPHLIFAALFFICGYIYIVTQTILDRKCSQYVSSLVYRIRVFVCCVCSLFVIYVVLQFFESLVIKTISAIFEIISALCIFIFLVTYLYEFTKMRLSIDFSFNSPTKQNNSLYED